MTLKQKLLWIAIGIGTVALIVVTSTAITIENAPRVCAQRAAARVAAIQAVVDRGINQGALVDEGARFLDAKHWDHSQLYRLDARFGGGRYYNNTPVVEVLLRNTAYSWPIREDIQIIFVFDDAKKLVRTDIFPIYTGP